MKQDREFRDLQKQYIDTLSDIKAGLDILAEGQKNIVENIYRNMDQQTKQLSSIAADIRVIREQIANIQLKYMLTDLKKEDGGKRNGNGNGNGNGNDKDKFKKLIEKEETVNKELLYRYIGKFMLGNWKILIFLIFLSLIGISVIVSNKAIVKWLFHIFG